MAAVSGVPRPPATDPPCDPHRLRNGLVIPLRESGAVLDGVKAKPFGWPSASLDPACGRLGAQLSERRARLSERQA
jgi:hypothetical protein